MDIVRIEQLSLSLPNLPLDAILINASNRILHPPTLPIEFSFRGDDIGMLLPQYLEFP